MGLYSNKGLYSGYKKNNKERQAEDYYSTPTEEVENILSTLKYDFTDKTILEPCVGGGHMAAGIMNYLQDNNQTPKKLIGTDIKNRGFISSSWELSYGDDLDFLGDDYPFNKADVIIMNPPYATLEPFFIRALEIVQEKLVVLCRTQALESESRYENIYKTCPPTDVYQYVDRVQCWRNGEKPTTSSVQAYCWLVWDKTAPAPEYPRFHFLRRANKKED